MVVIHSSDSGGGRHLQRIELLLTDEQVKDLEEELEDYNNHNDHLEPIDSIEEYIVFLLETLDREIG